MKPTQHPAPAVPDLPVEFARRTAYLPEPDALVLADVHLGRTYESAVDLPLGRGDARERLTTLLERFEPGEVVVAGDLLHSFSRVPREVELDLETVRETVAKAGASLVAVAGNHDTMLASVVEQTVPDAHRLSDGTVVAHGHDDPATSLGDDETPTAAVDGPPTTPLYVVGHEHPAITLEGQKHPCFLYGEAAHRGADVLVLPAFDRLARGTEVAGMLGDAGRSSVVVGSLGTCRPVVYDDEAGEALWFPPLAELEEHL